MPVTVKWELNYETVPLHFAEDFVGAYIISLTAKSFVRQIAWTDNCNQFTLT